MASVCAMLVVEALLPKARAAVGVVPLVGGLNNTTYVQPGTDISNLLVNARSGTTYEFATGTNGYPGVVPANFAALAFPTFALSNKQDIWLKGSGNTVWHMTNDGMLFGLQQCSNILMSGITFRGTLTNSTTYDATNLLIHGVIEGWGTNDQITFQNCRFENCNLFGLNLQGDGGGIQIRCNDLKFLNCVWIKCGHTNTAQPSGALDGGPVAGFPDLFVEHCLVERCSRGLENYSNINPTRNTVIRDTVFRHNFQRGIFFQQLAFGTRGIIEGCWFETDATARAGGGNITISQGDGWLIQGNTFTNIALAGGAVADWCISMDSTAYANLRNCQILNNYFSHVGHAVAFQNHFGGRISGNQFFFCTNSTIQFAADGAMITENLFQNCGLVADSFSQPIKAFFYPGTNCLITHNRFIRKTGGSPPAWIQLDSAQRGYIIRDNFFQDVSSGIPYIDDTGVGTRFMIGSGYLTNVVVAGAGNGNTNYTLFPWFDTLYLGSSNVNIAAVMNTTLGWTRNFTVNVTNLSANTWGIGFSAVTNRYHFRNTHTGGTNSPAVLTNNTLTKLEFECDGTNTNVRWHTQAHP